MNQTFTLKHIVNFQPNYGFSQRESLINSEAARIIRVLRERGFYPLGFEVTNKNDKTATVSVTYNVQ